VPGTRTRQEGRGCSPADQSGCLCHCLLSGEHARGVVPAGGGGSRIAGPGPYRWWGRREPDWGRSGRRAWSRPRRGVRTDLVRGRSALATPSPRTMSPCVSSSSRIAILTENSGSKSMISLGGPGSARSRTPQGPGPATGSTATPHWLACAARGRVVGDHVGQLVDDQQHERLPRCR
jgi:hypothetical protein